MEQLPNLKERALLAYLQNPDPSPPKIDNDTMIIIDSYLGCKTSFQRYILAVQNHHFLIADHYRKFIPHFILSTCLTQAICYGIETNDKDIINYVGFPEGSLVMCIISCIRAENTRLCKQLVDSYESINRVKIVDRDFYDELVTKEDIRFVAICEHSINARFLLYSIIDKYSDGTITNPLFGLQCVNQGFINYGELVKNIEYSEVRLNYANFSLLIKLLVEDDYANRNVNHLFSNNLLNYNSPRDVIKLFVVNQDLVGLPNVSVVSGDDLEKVITVVLRQYRFDLYRDGLYQNKELNELLSDLFFKGMILSSSLRLIGVNFENVSVDVSGLDMGTLLELYTDYLIIKNLCQA